MDYYELLGVKKDASVDEIKKAFRQKSKVLHPDAGGDPKVFSELNRAYHTLINENSRLIYDKNGITNQNTIDFESYAINFLSQLFSSIIEDTCFLGEEILDELYKECRERIHIRKKDLLFIKNNKESLEKKIGCIKKKKKEKGTEEPETIFDSIIKEKIKICEEEISLAEVDIKTIEMAQEMLNDYCSNDKKKINQNMKLNNYAKQLIEQGENISVSKLIYRETKE